MNTIPIKDDTTIYFWGPKTGPGHHLPPRLAAQRRRVGLADVPSRVIRFSAASHMTINRLFHKTEPVLMDSTLVILLMTIVGALLLGWTWTANDQAAF